MPPRARRTEVICKCKSHCTTYDPVTGTYHGDGHLIPRSTRDNHSADDKKRAAQSIHLITMPATLQQQNRGDWIKIANDELNVLLELPITSPTKPLCFANSPGQHGAFVLPTDADLIRYNQGLYSLTGHRSNQGYLATESRLCNLMSIYGTGHNVELEGDRDDLIDRLYDALRRIAREKGNEWAQQRGRTEDGSRYVNTDTFFAQTAGQHPTRRAACLLSLVMENIHFNTRRALRVQLAGFRSLLRTSGASEELITSIPKDPRSTSRDFNLDPVTRNFITCNSCHSLYPYQPSDGVDGSLLSHCISSRTPESPICNTPLWTTRNAGTSVERTFPTRKYLHQDLKSWLGRQLARPGVEDLLDNPFLPNLAETVDDIWRSRVFTALKDRRGQPFFPSRNKEGRVVFSLAVDGFNPFYNKTAKQNVSSTGIWLVLLNLPQHLRYLPENMYLAGVIPADKPSKEDIYTYIELVIAELLEFWEHGVFFSRTHRERFGRLFEALLIPVICDMPGARQLLGLGTPTSHHFCTFCNLDIDDIEVCDRSQWPAKDLEQIRHYAELWRDAPNEKVRSAIFAACGIRWTPLLDLPYWNPILYAVVDSMHALDLNLLQNHCRDLFQINLERPGGDASSITPLPSRQKRVTTKQDIDSLKRCARKIVENDVATLLNELLRYSRRVLYTICDDNQILGGSRTVITGTKWVLAQNIIAWRQRPSFTVMNTSPADGVGPDDGDGDEEIDDNVGDNDDALPATLPPQENLNMHLVATVIRLLVDRDNTEESRHRAYGRGSAVIFSYICDRLEISKDGIDELNRRHAKRALFDRLMASVDDDVDLYDRLRSFVVDEVPSPDRAVLGLDIMQAVWDDMTKTQLPTWITPAPRNWGTAKRGKLTADNWRVICTIHLPITLIRLWGDVGGRKKELLDHFMHLVSAVRIANMRVSSDAQAEAYRQHIHHYVENVRRLYPDQNLKPSYHVALHIYDFLHLFGPVHSHSSPHYERYINFLHRINTNGKLGELEATMLRCSSRYSNLRSLLTDDVEARRVLEEALKVMDQIDSEDARGFYLASILDPEAPTFLRQEKAQPGILRPAYYRALCDTFANGAHISNNAKFVKQVSSRGVVYGVHNASSHKNSAVMFHSSTGALPGIIYDIFLYQLPSSQIPEVFLSIEALAPIVGTNSDPFRDYGSFGGFLCKSEETTPYVIRLSQIISHYALTKFTDGKLQGTLHVLPIDRLVYEFPFDT